MTSCTMTACTAVVIVPILEYCSKLGIPPGLSSQAGIKENSFGFALTLVEVLLLENSPGVYSRKRFFFFSQDYEIQCLSNSR